jgi:TRAP-type C4-dicarboxylate transport system permease small subunit
MGKNIFICAILIFQGSQTWAQMTYEGRLTPNESRAWLYGSLTVFALLLLLVYNLEKISPWIRERFRKFTGK